MIAERFEFIGCHAVRLIKYARFVEIAEKMRREEGIDSLALAGTEIPLLLRNASGLSMPLLDTTAIHVERAVATMIE